MVVGDKVLAYSILIVTAIVSVVLYLKLNIPRKRFKAILVIFLIFVSRIIFSLIIETFNIGFLEYTLGMDIIFVLVFLILTPIWVAVTALSYTWHSVIEPKELFKPSRWIDKPRPPSDFYDLTIYFIFVLMIIFSFSKMLGFFY